MKGRFYRPSFHAKGCGSGGAEFHEAHADTGHSKIFYAELKPFSTVFIQTLKCYDRHLKPPGRIKAPSGGSFLLLFLFDLPMLQFSLGFNTVTMTVK